MNPTKVKASSLRLMLYTIFDFAWLWGASVSLSLFLSLSYYFILTFLETETPVLPLAWAGWPCVSLPDHLFTDRQRASLGLPVLRKSD